jgi:hypothetical protein
MHALLCSWLKIVSSDPKVQAKYPDCFQVSTLSSSFSAVAAVAVSRYPSMQHCWLQQRKEAALVAVGGGE